MTEKFCRMFVDMSGKFFWGMSGKIFLVTPPPARQQFGEKNINVKLSCSGKLYCAPPKQDDAHTPMSDILFSH